MRMVIYQWRKKEYEDLFLVLLKLPNLGLNKDKSLLKLNGLQNQAQ